jgi:hypothetical protein
MRTPMQRPAVLALALLVLTALAFWPALGGDFLFDDYTSIVNQEKVHAESLDWASLRKAASSYEGTSARPIATASFAVDHAFWGLNAKGYKITNLIVHLLNAVLVFVLVRRLLLCGESSVRNTWLFAFVLAMAWAIHPLQVSTVQYVVQRMEMMSLTFVLSGLIAYIHGRQLQIAGARGWPWIGIAAVAAATGLLAKETAILFPAYTLALELTVLGFGAAKPAISHRWKYGYALAAAVGVAIFAFVVLPYYLAPEAFAMRDYGPGERVLTQLRILPMYLGWILLPQPANYVFYYDHLAASQGLLSPATTLAGGLFLLALLALAWTQRRRMPLAALGLFWFFASHLLSSNIAPLELVFEHRNYFAVLGVLLTVADLVSRLPEGQRPMLRKATVAIVLAGLLVLTLIRSATWGDPLILASTLSKNNPESARASMDLGEQYMILAQADPASRYYALARDEFERGSRVPNASPMPEQGLIVLAATAGQAAEPEWWDRVVEKLKRRAIGPQEQVMIIGLLELSQGDVAFDHARFAEAYSVMIDKLPMPPTQYYLFAKHALTKAGDEKLALAIYRRSIENGDAEFAAAVVEALHRDGYREAAQAVADHARTLGLADITLPKETPASDAEAEVPGETD